MRKFFILAGFVLVSSLLFAQNKMQMVTYFPVPYVAYNDIEVTQFCEVGLLNQCNMALGPGDPVQNPYTLNVYKSAENGVLGNKLNTGVLRVKSGTLNLNSQGVNNKIMGNTLEAGSGATQNNSEISFEHRLNVSGTNNVPSRSVTGETKSEIKQLKMFPDRIANNLPGCAEGVTWQRVRIGMSSAGPLDEVFLVCGTPVINQVCKSAKPSTERTCSTGCGKQTRTVSCNVNTGQWDTGAWTGACSNPPKTFRNCIEGCGTQTRTYSCNGTRWVPTQWTGSCWAPYGGGQTRDCSSGCGTETSTSTCSGASWSGDCWSPYCNKSCGCSQCGSQYCESSCDGGYCSGDCWSPYGGGNETQDCGNGGTQSRYCSSTCYGASCPPWGSCEGESIDCPSSSKPSSSETCNGCGTRTRSVTCNTSTGSWSTGSWSSCSKTEAECNPSECTDGATSGSQECNGCGTQTTKKCVGGKWTNQLGACSKEKSECITDCCAADFKGNFSECLKTKYGATSKEYKCYTGTAYECGVAVFGGGSDASICMGSYTGGQIERCELCFKDVPELKSFRAGGYHRYACNGAPRKCTVKTPSDSDSKFSCGQVYSVVQNYSYSNYFGYVECLNNCSERAKCPANIKPGVLMNMEHGGLSCWSSCYCNYPSEYGKTAYGSRTQLRLKKIDRLCTSDEVQWL